MNNAILMTRVEVVRVFRNKRYLIFTLALPVMMYLIFGKHHDQTPNDVATTVNVFYMISMATLGAFSGALMGSANRISTERKTGWTRQLRLSPLPSWAYITGKMGAALATSVPSVAIVLVLGHFYGKVHLSLDKWIFLALIIWLGSAVFAALSVALGYRFDPEAIQPATMLVYLPMVLLGGIYFAPPKGVMHDVATWLPTWRIGEMSDAVVYGGPFPGTALAVVLGWLGLFAALAVVSVRTAYRQES
jgi:ABC-2 type transport system permease protein